MQSIYSERMVFTPIFHVIKSKRYLGVLLASGLLYAAVYMVVVGIISYVPGLTSATGSYPMIRSTAAGISIIPANDFFFFIIYGALAFLVASSFLVGLNVALMFYSRKAGQVCGIKNSNKRTESKAFLGLLPAFFTSFACCGGGLLALVIGTTAFSSLSLYGEYMAPITLAVLAAGTFFMSSKISKMEKRC
jgi:hypothetical protein